MVNVIGLGYIGLPTALMMAASGLQVVGTDISEGLVASLSAGRAPFSEDGLGALLEKALGKGVRFSTEYQAADEYIVSVPTPYDPRSKKVDSSYVEAAVSSVLDVCPKGALIIVESTVSPGTIDKRVRPLVERRGFTPGADIHLSHAPERIIPGRMLIELALNSRTIGADDEAAGLRASRLYASFCEGEIVRTSIRVAEMTKVVENAYRDINIAYANELAKICGQDGIDVREVIAIANMHPRVSILSPGPGVGGHCISVDPWFLVGDYPGLANIILAARKINDSMPEYVLGRVRDVMRAEGLGDVSRVGLYGLTYKENVDDTRESPALQMLESMDRHLGGGGVRVYDPFVKKDIAPNQAHSLDEFLGSVDMVVILVGHDEIKGSMGKLEGKVVLDTRNVCQLDGVHRL